MPSALSPRMSFESAALELRLDGDPHILLVGDHASNALPPVYGTLGLPEASFSRHIACDLGIAALAADLSAALNAPAILAGFSRLLIDPNRGEDDPTLVMRLSDGEIIPGNARADAAEIAARIANFHRPYHMAIDHALGRAITAGAEPLLISLHSFTPVWRGTPRPWHCGVLWAGDRKTANHLLAAFSAEGDLVVGDNQPYSGELEEDCMDRHGTQRGIAHALIEIRQDLLATEKGRAEWTARLSRILKALVEARTAQATKPIGRPA